MDIQQAYDSWAAQYDENKNNTRDLEAVALRATLAHVQFNNCLEIGCGTGKNTEWLLTKAEQVSAVDFSSKMLEKARQKITSAKVTFHQADVTEEWRFAQRQYDLVTFSLVLEHIEDLGAILSKASRAVAPKGMVYIGELHPYKQYQGTKARFDTVAGQQVLTCYRHDLSDFTKAATTHGFSIENIDEYFDDADRASLPRILALLLRKR
ncbi:class I SAM-dependent methyltransferase [Pontibacter akesuensis]|uniref:Methyltransferase domain-containing protein n=1 Tax=Pontibacter akesuensis TaxID=388950 RepID=A0A1I7HVE5_9BACT|nr:class I SAM-dependent methyltransferase [Pontibacter akesuensis]GHA63715.1 hypothetical protein GCM10007389_15410 [Pontibacter akesuensis]SFU64621.1 Methyltransferase domain-containing protein [Pontibacter akesuensis]